MSPVATTLLILVVAVVALMSNRIPLGIVAIGVSVSLWLTGILDLNDALAGFGKALAFPLFLAFVFGVAGIVGFSALVGKLVGYSIPMSVAIGLTSLYGFPGTMILSQEAAKGAGETSEEVAAIENSILPKMIVAGFSTVTITSVIITSIIAGRIGN